MIGQCRNCTSTTSQHVLGSPHGQGLRCRFIADSKHPSSYSEPVIGFCKPMPANPRQMGQCFDFEGLFLLTSTIVESMSSCPLTSLRCYESRPRVFILVMGSHHQHLTRFPRFGSGSSTRVAHLTTDHSTSGSSRARLSLSSGVDERTSGDLVLFRPGRRYHLHKSNKICKPATGRQSLRHIHDNPMERMVA